jgi:hypothetical protein
MISRINPPKITKANNKNRIINGTEFRIALKYASFIPKPFLIEKMMAEIDMVLK